MDQSGLEYIGGGGTVSAFSVVWLAAPQHGHQDGRKAVSDTPKGTAMVVARVAEARVVRLAEWIVLNAAPRQMVHRVSKPLAAPAPHDHLLGLATLLRYRRNSAVGSQCPVVALRQRVSGFCE